MELIISKLRIQTLKARWLLRQFHCESLEMEFSTNQKAGLAYRWDDMLKEGHVLQLMIDLLERQEKEERGCAESLIPKA